MNDMQITLSNPTRPFNGGAGAICMAESHEV
jgi:hypothetical protein